jgi:hypothetical protein
MAKLPGWLAFLADPLLNQRDPWKPRLEARDGYWSLPMRVNVVQIGELVLVSDAAETFTEIGLRIKQNSPARHTLFTSLTEGCISYLHTAGSYSEGGYEVDAAPLAYRYPGRLKAECEAIALDRTRHLLARLWEKKDDPNLTRVFLEKEDTECFNDAVTRFENGMPVSRLIHVLPCWVTQKTLACKLIIN